MYDIASSKYKQLCEIRKISSENLEVTEKEKSEKTEWEPKAKRMMQLCLTDGVQDVIAIEYTPVKQIIVKNFLYLLKKNFKEKSIIFDIKSVLYTKYPNVLSLMLYRMLYPSL
jgi:hypothetical protein